MAVMHLDSYQFGRLVVDGRQIDSDVLVTPAGIEEHWRRREGHLLQIQDLGAVLADHPKRLIVGAGSASRMRPGPGLEQELAGLGVVAEVLPTAAALDRINELIDSGDSDWAAALHLTC